MNLHAKRTAKSAGRHRFRRAPKPSRLFSERLEDRRMLAVFTVTSLDFVSNLPGELTLDRAILLANDAPGPDTIVFDPALFSTPRTIELPRQLLQIQDPVTIIGPGSHLLTLDAGLGTDGIENPPGQRDGWRIFDVRVDNFLNDDTPEIEVAISGLTLTGAEIDEQGGAILNHELLTLTDVVIDSNFAAEGGGIHTINDLKLIRSVVSNNRASRPNGAFVGRGGGIFAVGSPFTSPLIFVDIEQSSIFGNVAFSQFSPGQVDGSSGGGIRNESSSVLTIERSTISENLANFGSAIDNVGFLSLRDSTVALNVALLGGAIESSDTQVTAQLNNTIVASNLDFETGQPGSDFVGQLGSLSTFNLIGSGNLLSGISNGVNGNQIGTLANSIDPRLGPLVTNGGTTPTHRLLPGSPAIDRGSSAFATDQRGAPFARNVDDLLAAGTGADIGAYELQDVTAGALIVDTLSDVDDGNFGSGQLSLREAIIIANGSVGADIIEFDPTLFAVPRTILIRDQLPTIVDALTINGPQQALLTIDGGFDADDEFPEIANRIFSVDDQTTDRIEVVLRDLQLRGGRARGVDEGGAIFNAERLTLDRVRTTANQSVFGGAIANGGTLSIVDSTLDVNRSAFGGAVANKPGGIVSISRSTIRGNGGQFADGGAIHNRGTLTIADSTLHANVAFGGGAVTNQNAGTVSISRSTISGNRAESGFASALQNDDGAVAITDSTIVENSGGQIVGDITLKNSIVWSGNATTFPEIDGTVLPGSGNNLIGTNPLIGPLADNGGTTLTHALLPGSPAIDAGASSETFDQRGAPFVRAFGGGVDIGAVEFVPTSLVVDSLSDESDLDYRIGEFTLREAIEIANATPGHNAIAFDAARASGVILLQEQLPTVVQPVTITGLGANQLTIDADHQSRLFRIALGAEATITDLTMTRGDAQGEHGGAIDNRGVLTLHRVAITDSIATQNGGRGGAIYSQGPLDTAAQRLTITASTIAGNEAAQGGGIFIREGSATITQTTISGNRAQNGGAMTKFGGFGTVAIANSTITNNTASDANAGIAKLSFSGPLKLNSTILADNRLDNDTPSNLGGAGIGNVQGHFNLLGSDAPAFGSSNLTSDQPLLGPLADNGGPTPTHALLVSSPAINAGPAYGLGPGVLDDYSSNQFGTNYTFRGIFDAPQNAPQVTGGEAQLNVGNGTAAFVWNRGDRLQAVGDQVSVQFELKQLTGGPPINSAGLSLFSDPVGGSLLVEARVERAFVFPAFHLVVGGLRQDNIGTPTGPMTLAIRVTGKTATGLNLRYTLSAAGINTITVDDSVASDVAYFGPSAFGVFGDESKHDNLTFTTELISPGDHDQRGAPFVRNVDGVDIGAFERESIRIEDSPVVVDVFVDSTEWAPDFRDFVDEGFEDPSALGFRMPKGSEQLETLPWINLNRIRVQFNKDVGGTLGLEDFSLASAPGFVTFKANGQLGIIPDLANEAFFSYDDSTFTATLTLKEGVFLETSVIDLRIESAGVQDAGGIPLNGEWASGLSLGNSGDLNFGGDFFYRMLVLPGDVLGGTGDDGVTRMVGADDLERVRALQNGVVSAGLGQVGHDIRADVDGRNSSSIAGTESVINAMDFEALRTQQNAFILGSTQTFAAARAVLLPELPVAPAGDRSDPASSPIASIDHVFAAETQRNEQLSLAPLGSRDRISRLTWALRTSASSALVRWSDQTVDEVFAGDASPIDAPQTLVRVNRRQIRS